jgi:hypothetical protein
MAGFQITQTVWTIGICEFCKVGLLFVQKFGTIGSQVAENGQASNL